MKICYLIAALLAVSVTACTTTQKTQPSVQKQAATRQRVYIDPALGHKIGIVGVNETLTLDGMLKVQIEFVNKTGSLQHFNTLFEWFDTNGTLLSTPTSTAIPHQAEAHESLFISAVAPSLIGKDFRVKVIADHR